MESCSATGAGGQTGPRFAWGRSVVNGGFSDNLGLLDDPDKEEEEHLNVPTFLRRQID